jgi:hypothetical protein
VHTARLARGQANVVGGHAGRVGAAIGLCVAATRLFTTAKARIIDAHSTHNTCRAVDVAALLAGTCLILSRHPAWRRRGRLRSRRRRSRRWGRRRRSRRRCGSDVAAPPLLGVQRVGGAREALVAEVSGGEERLTAVVAHVTALPRTALHRAVQLPAVPRRDALAVGVALSQRLVAERVLHAQAVLQCARRGVAAVHLRGCRLVDRGGRRREQRDEQYGLSHL